MAWKYFGILICAYFSTPQNASAIPSNVWSEHSAAFAYNASYSLKSCTHPGILEKGRVVFISPSGLYELHIPSALRSNNNTSSEEDDDEQIPSGGNVLYVCDQGHALIGGSPGRTCLDGEWLPSPPPKCVEYEDGVLKRVKRRAIKPGGGSIVRSKIAGGIGGGGPGTRRGKKKGNRLSEDDEYESVPMICSNLDHDKYIEAQVITEGSEVNVTFSEGAVVKVSCKLGFGVNLPNETIRCEKGRWRPKVPQCSELPCKAPYVQNSIFYDSANKPLYFQEMKKHTAQIEIRCLKGHKLRGPSKFLCSYGEWDVEDAPECVPSNCKLPKIDYGNYLGMHNEVGNRVPHGAEVDYACGGSYRKLLPGPVRCELGEWRPQPPICIHPQDGKRPAVLQGGGKKGCPNPGKVEGAHTFVNSLPLLWKVQTSFPDGTEVIHRCANMKEKGLKSKWKITCEDGKWAGQGNISCELNTPKDKSVNFPNMNMINGSCVYKRVDKHVISFQEDEMILEDKREFPHETIVTSRCTDIGKFRLNGAKRRKCLSGQWMGITPKCNGLSQFQDYDSYSAPTILIRHENGSLVQSMDGKLVVIPGTTVHMECLWLRKFGTPSWSTSNRNKTYPEGWAEAPGRDNQLEYRITIDNVGKEDEGMYSCKTPSRHSHEIFLEVKEASCFPLPEDQVLMYSTTETVMGTYVNFTCARNMSLVGAEEIFCTDKGKWSTPLPVCRDIQCSDISLLPAFLAPMAHTASVNKNGTLRRNDTAPPKVHIYGTHVGSKATFSCEQGFMVEGEVTEAICQQNGEWSVPMPLCKEVECPPPPIPEHGLVENEGGKIKYKAGEFVNFGCKEGYKVEGNPLLACQDNGKWSKATGLRCQLACPYPGTVIFGTMKTPIKFYYDIGETVEFTCNPDYEMHGESKMICLKNGRWNVPIPNCNPIMVPTS